MRFSKFSLCAALGLSLLVPSFAAMTPQPSADRYHITDAQIDRLLDTLLSENAQIVAARARSAVALERVPQARALPDPSLSYRYFARSPETRVGPQEQTLEISQGVPWGGKRRLQAQRAETLAAGLDWEVEDLARRLVADLKRAYFEAAYLQEAITVNAEERDLLRRFESIALKRYSTGQGIQQHVVKAQANISALDAREIELRQRLGIVERQIASLIGRPELSLGLDPILLALPSLNYDRSELEQLALERHPSVRAVEERVEADRIWGKRQALESKPNFRFGLGYTLVGQREDIAGLTSPPQGNGQDILALTVGANIPIFRARVRSGVAEARKSEAANEQMLAAVRDQLRFEVQGAALQLRSLDERSHLYLEVIIPQARESLASAEAAYATDRLGFLDLLDAERVLFQSRLAFHRLVADLWIAMATLERSSSQPFPPAR